MTLKHTSLILFIQNKGFEQKAQPLNNHASSNSLSASRKLIDFFCNKFCSRKNFIEFEFEFE